jgi:hypothetical protein
MIPSRVQGFPCALILLQMNEDQKIAAMMVLMIVIMALVTSYSIFLRIIFQ